MKKTEIKYIKKKDILEGTDKGENKNRGSIWPTVSSLKE